MDAPSLSFCQQNPFRLTQYFFRSNYPEFYNWLCEKYPDIRLSEKLYKYYHPDVQNICPICGKPTNYINFTKGYAKHCSYTCSALDDNTLNKRKKTSQKKYGTDSPTQAESVKAKTRETMKERYGVEHILQNPEYMEKVRQTNLERLGVEYPGQAESVKSKNRETCLKKYGVEYAYQAEEVKEKIRQTNLERLGVEYPMQSEAVQAKSRNTCQNKYNVPYSSQAESIKKATRDSNLIKYGVEWPGQTEEVKERRKRTMLEKYGVENAMQNPEISQKSLQTYRNNWISSSENDVIGYTPDGQWICKCPHPECNKCTEKYFIIPVRLHSGRINGKTEICTRLLPIGDTRSSLEIGICRLLDTYNINYETSNRSILGGRELDIYIPDKKIAIECNGVYWHSYENKPMKYHLNKWQECKNQGIQLLTIWEDWIINKPDIVKSLLLSKLGIYEHRIGARQCKVVEVNPKAASEFLDKNHIQGASTSTVKLGLEYKGELVALMTFGKRKPGQGRKGDPDWELLRFCSLRGWQIQGGAQKLFTHFLKTYKPEKVVSFSSNDISIGNLYRTLGFTSDEKPTLSYWYINIRDMERYHRFTFSKNQIIKKGMAPDLDKSLWTEREVMEKTDYVRIYDCGQLKWIYNNLL